MQPIDHRVKALVITLNIELPEIVRYFSQRFIVLRAWGTSSWYSYSPRLSYAQAIRLWILGENSGLSWGGKMQLESK